MKPPVKMIALRRIRPKLTSYEMVWATARRAPTSAYLELDAHPEPKIEYTARLDSASTNKMLRLRSATGWGSGIGVQRAKEMVSASMGVTRNRSGDEDEGRTGSLMNSLTPSAMGCRRP